MMLCVCVCVCVCVREREREVQRMKVGEERAVNTVGHEVPGRERDSHHHLLLVCDVLIVHVMCVRAEEPSHEAVGAAAVVSDLTPAHTHIHTARQYIWSSHAHTYVCPLLSESLAHAVVL